jgi:hypothetical protein
MRSNTLLLFLAGSLVLQACPKTPPVSSGDSVASSDRTEESQETITFRDKKLPAGTQIRVVESMTLAADLTGRAPQAGEVFQGRMARNDYTAMEVSIHSHDAQERDVTLRYEESWSKEGDAARSGPLLDSSGRIAPGLSDAFEPVEEPTSGQTYRVRWTPTEGNSVQFAPEGEEDSAPGSPRQAPSERETEEVLTDADRLLDLGIHSPSGVGSLLDGKSIRVGETLTLSGAEMAQLLGEVDQDMTFTNLLLTLSRLDDRSGVRCAVWSFTAEGRMTDDWIQGSMDLEGEFIVSVDGLAIHQMSMWGPFNIQGVNRTEGGEVTIEGAGRMEGMQVLTYSFDALQPPPSTGPSPGASSGGSSGSSD